MKGKKKIQNKPKDKRESDKQEEKEGTKRRGEREKTKKKQKKRGMKEWLLGVDFHPQQKTQNYTTGNPKTIQINIYINHQELRKADCDRPSNR